MRSTSNVRSPSWRPLLCAATALMIAGCDASRRDPAEEMEEPREDRGALREDSAPRSAPADTVHVSLRDGAIEMPTTLPAGPVAFHVQNAGSLEHNFEIEGQGMEEKLSENLQAGEAGVLVVELEPGTFEVYCPVGDHEDRGMKLQVTVQ